MRAQQQLGPASRGLLRRALPLGVGALAGIVSEIGREGADQVVLGGRPIGAGR